MDAFLTPAQVVELQDLLRRGKVTVQEMQDPPPIVQLRRLNVVSGEFEDVGDPVHLIRLKFGLREVRETERTVPITHRSSDGDLEMWEADYDALGLFNGDRFQWGDQVVEVSAVYPPRNGSVVAEVNIAQR